MASSAMSKRAQARNEQAVQELIRSVPGNDRCADCQARNPGWASWSLGIFLCMRCAALHRKLGTHISKVKSLSMDAWTNEQVAHMKSMGNEKANATWNPQRKQPAIPVDADEVDSAMERFIRQKYEQRIFTVGNSSKAPTRSPTAGFTTSPRDTRPDSPVSLDENPPPPPPKPGRKFAFGLRSASSGSFLSRSNKKSGRQETDPEIATSRPNKESRVFGATIGVTEGDRGLEMKLLQLREMGFSDFRRNTSVLQGNGGDLERTIESLVKLAEADKASEAAKGSSYRKETSSSSPGLHISNGASILPNNQLQSSPQSTPRTAQSTNPFEKREASATSAFDAVMARMNISAVQPQEQQFLFPNATGGHLALTPPIQQSTFQHPMTPPVSSLQQFPNNPYAQQPLNNPFITTPLMSHMNATTPFAMAPQSASLHNPFAHQTIPQGVLTPQYATFPMHQQQTQSQLPSNILDISGSASQQFIQNPAFQQQQPTNGFHNPYQQQAQPLPNAPFGRLDKNSIMALYNQPQMTSSSPLQSSQEQTFAPGLQAPTYENSPRRSATMPVTSSNNPFSIHTPAPVMPVFNQPQPHAAWASDAPGNSNPFYNSNNN